MLEERGTAIIENEAGWIVPTGSHEEVKFWPKNFAVVNGQQVRFWRFPNRRDWAQYVLALHDDFNPRALVAMASGGAGLTTRATHYLERRAADMLVSAQRAATEQETLRQLADLTGTAKRIGELRVSGAKPLGVRTVRNVLARQTGFKTRKSQG
ncbi:hypothetical protein [Massilia sp.]|uniref:hypothetical protein n=1 Tax=Massilia sp. TaxID=1882437 RepID=UPI00289F9180|nr:hypothetical protein [Massilia sp.]